VLVWRGGPRDWEVLAGVKWVAGSVRGEAVRGAGRCRQITAGAGTAAGSTTEKVNQNQNTSQLHLPAHRAPKSLKSPPNP
jgi:hypothetical protein